MPQILVLETKLQLKLLLKFYWRILMWVFISQSKLTSDTDLGVLVHRGKFEHRHAHVCLYFHCRVQCHWQILFINPYKIKVGVCWKLLSCLVLTLIIYLCWNKKRRIQNILLITKRLVYVHIHSSHTNNTN